MLMPSLFYQDNYMNETKVIDMVIYLVCATSTDKTISSYCQTHSTVPWTLSLCAGLSCHGCAGHRHTSEQTISISGKFSVVIIGAQIGTFFVCVQDLHFQCRSWSLSVAESSGEDLLHCSTP